MNRLVICLLLLILNFAVAGCDRLVPANQKMMKDAIRASDQSVRSEEKTWAMLLRIEELSQRLEKAVEAAQKSATRAEQAALEARNTTRNVSQAEAAAGRAKEASQQAEDVARQAGDAARQAEEAVRRIEAQEGESLQQILEFMRELGYKP